MLHACNQHIRMPERRRFVGTDTMSTGEDFYTALCHEPVHWSGARKRLDRDLSDPFDSESYRIEELVAEPGSAFLCNGPGITPELYAYHGLLYQE